MKIILADDREIVRAVLKAALAKQGNSIEVVGEASNGNSVLELARVNPGCIYVLDIAIPLLDGLQTTEQLLKIDPKNKAIILSMHDDRALVEKAFKSGARGYVLKTYASQDIVQALHEVEAGRYFLSPALAGIAIEDFLGEGKAGATEVAAKDLPGEGKTGIGGVAVKDLPGEGKAGTPKGRQVQLTDRERKVLQLISEGLTNKEIAKKLEITANTVHIHRSSIMSKLGIHNTAGLIRYALKEKISEL